MILNLLCACLFAGALGYSATAQPLENNEEIVIRQENKKCVSYDDSHGEITLDLSELINYTFPNLGNLLLNDNTFFANSTVYMYVLQDESYANATLDEVVDGTVSWLNAFADGSNNVYFYYDDTDFLYHFDYYAAYDDDSLRYAGFEQYPGDSISIGVSENNYSAFKNAIELDIAANNSSDDMPAVLSDFVSILVGGITDLAGGIATGVVSMASALFLEVDGQGAVTGLSVFGGIVAIFAGLALAVGITTKVYTWITSLGN